MRIFSRALGWLTWLSVNGHLGWMWWHSYRASFHARRKADHEAKAEARLNEAAEEEKAARTLAPRKPKVIAEPVTAPKGRALQVIASPPPPYAGFSVQASLRTGDDTA